MKLPSEAEIEALHRKYAPDEAAYQSVHTHCQIVWEIAQQLITANKLPIDTELTFVGCMLHDLGVYRFKRSGGDYIRHGIYGYEMLQAEGLPEAICRFASHHTGVGVTKEEIIDNNLPLPHQDFLAETPEERLVMYADKFTSKHVPPKLNSYESYRAFVAKHGKQKQLLFDKLAEEFGKPDLVPIAARYGQQII